MRRLGWLVSSPVNQYRIKLPLNEHLSFLLAQIILLQAYFSFAVVTDVVPMQSFAVRSSNSFPNNTA
jgi:hypothetical protein